MQPKPQTPERIWANAEGHWSISDDSEYRQNPSVEYVRATDYDALAVKLAEAEQRERQLLDTTATCRMLRRELNTEKAKLAEADAMIEAQQKDYASNNVRFAEAEHRAEAAEAALVAVYRLAMVDAATACDKERDEARANYCFTQAAGAVWSANAIRALPTPTAAAMLRACKGGASEPDVLDDTSPRAAIGEIGNQIHNIGCEYQGNEGLCERLAELASQCWTLAQKLSPEPAPVTISEAARKRVARIQTGEK